MNAYLVVVDTLADWEIGYLCAELHSRRFFANPLADFSFRKVGLTTAAVTSMGGVIHVPDLALADLVLEPGDVLILPGGERWDEPELRPVLELVRDVLDAGHHVAAICGAVDGLGSVGALDKRRHTSNDLGYLKQSCPDYRGEKLYRHEPAVRGDNLLTATGLAPLEFSAEVLKMLKVWRPETIRAWYQLHKTRKERWYHALVASMGPAAE
ncbi:glutamine amidotransferase [Massilia dura]|uniref:Glutamine amidotransferase n=1 Tax=Pseudoduganella dura TaxID=321982 RepID=A0A6I3XPL0_9BURK|nr:DJ-1/PfpI family protein [Pseudoduganella dura]MUI16413.1 glutamine amidotransferase [Pseudoduganella dura]GGX86578.1 putative protease YoaZ [Pseudoduganella dura]